MATTTPNFGWVVPTSTDLVKDGATAIETLGDSIDASFVGLKGGTTGQVLSKTSGTDLAFTWVAQDDSNAIQNAIVTAKGDLIGATSNATPARLGVGTNGYVLTADSTASTGIAWAAAAAGGGLTLISTTTLSGASVNLNSISGSYTNLQLVIKNAYASANDYLYVRCNGDTGTNYSRRQINITTGGGVASGTSSQTSSLTTLLPTTSNVANNGFVVVDLYNYTDTSGGQLIFSTGSGLSGSDPYGMWTANVYAKSAAITSLTVGVSSGTFSGGTVLLYGVE